MWRTQRHQILSSPRGHGLLSVWDDTGFRTAKGGRSFGLQNYKMYFEQEPVKLHLYFLRFFFFLHFTSGPDHPAPAGKDFVWNCTRAGFLYFSSSWKWWVSAFNTTPFHAKAFLESEQKHSPLPVWPSVFPSLGNFQREWLQTRETSKVRSFGRAELKTMKTVPV